MLAAGVGHVADVDAAGVDAFFVFGYVPGPETILRDVRQLPPGSTLAWDAETRTTRVAGYWSPPAPLDRGVIAHQEAVEEVDALLVRSVRSRMLADVPLGVLLSGGVDSTLIAAVAAEVSSAPVKTFTVGYDVGDVNETEPAREAARLARDRPPRARPHRPTRSPARAPAVLARLDQPLADQALVAMHAVSAFARREVTVAVGGEGADELFGGYPRYRWLQRAEALEERLPRPLAAAVARALATAPAGRVRELARVVAPASAPERQLDWVTARRRHMRDALYGPRLRDRLGDSPVAGLRTLLEGGVATNGSTGIAGRLMRLDQLHWLADDVLVKADRASMQVSLEVRTPYLHPELAEVCAAAGTATHLGRRRQGDPPRGPASVACRARSPSGARRRSACPRTTGCAARWPRPLPARSRPAARSRTVGSRATRRGASRPSMPPERITARCSGR